MGARLSISRGAPLAARCLGVGRPPADGAGPFPATVGRPLWQLYREDCLHSWLGGAAPSFAHQRLEAPPCTKEVVCGAREGGQGVQSWVTHRVVPWGREGTVQQGGPGGGGPRARGDLGLGAVSLCRVTRSLPPGVMRKFFRNKCPRSLQQGRIEARGPASLPDATARACRLLRSLRWEVRSWGQEPWARQSTPHAPTQSKSNSRILSS